MVNNAQENAASREVDQPGTDDTAAHDAGERCWTEGRPVTTLAGDQRIFQPGGHHEPGEQSQNAVRVSEAEASVLQGFPPDLPWQGSKTARFRCIGNAVPPPLAKAVLSALLARPQPDRRNP